MSASPPQAAKELLADSMKTEIQPVVRNPRGHFGKPDVYQVNTDRIIASNQERFPGECRGRRPRRPNRLVASPAAQQQKACDL